MKKYDHKPDFHKLCSPGQKHIWAYISQLIFYFFLASIGGFLWEVLIFLVKEGQYHNRGFFYGPWLPVYGVGAVLLYIVLQKVKKHPIAVFLLSVSIGTVLELAIGWLLDAVWGMRYWDYSSYLLNFRGYICLWSALGFGIAGTIWVCFLSGFLEKLWFKIPLKTRRAINTVLILLFILDCAAALIFPNAGNGITFP